MELFFWIILILSIMSLVYYIAIIVYAGFGTTFSGFWLTAGVIGLGVCNGIGYMLRHGVVLISSLQFFVIVIVIVALSVFVIIEGIIIYYSHTKADDGNDYIIILGAEVKGTKISKTLKRRLDTAVRYLLANSKTVAVVSGGQGKKEAISEAEAMQNYMSEKGISSERILKEERSTNTFENILYSKSLLNPHASVAIVTNGFHLFRAISLAKKQGIGKVQGIVAPTDKILAINYYMREAIGVLKDKLLGNM